MNLYYKYFFFLCVAFFTACNEKDVSEQPAISVVRGYIDGREFNLGQSISAISLQPEIRIEFTEALQASTITADNIMLGSNGNTIPSAISIGADQKTVIVKPTAPLSHWNLNTLSFSKYIKSAKGGSFSGLVINFYTPLDTTDKFPKLTKEELMDKVQRQTFNYVWGGGHPVSGLAPERNTSPNTVTIGGSGFGVMAMIAMAERGFITRQAVLGRLDTITDFLLNKADRFHGMWPHWINGTTGKVIPFSTKDDGADIVESSFMFQALIALKSYLNTEDPQEKIISDRIDRLWSEADWTWFTRGGEQVLYWHWSPNYGWDMNHQIVGYNECLITYVLAAASPTHSITAETYNRGWARNGAMKNGKIFYNYILPLGPDKGGPLFFSHYSFLGLDPTNLKDQYANYWEQNVNHTMINRAYCISNPQQYFGYSSDFWGLTASDDYKGYLAHEPNRDNGTVSPTAAVASIPYTPEESMRVIEFMYYKIGDKMWGKQGFYDAINPSVGVVSRSYLAIDQGPQIVMIENYRSQLLWNLFMSNKDVKNGLNKLGFQ